MAGRNKGEGDASGSAAVCSGLAEALQLKDLLSRWTSYSLSHQELGEGKATCNSTIHPAELVCPSGERGQTSQPLLQGGEERKLLMVMGSKDSLKQIRSQMLPCNSAHRSSTHPSSFTSAPSSFGEEVYAQPVSCAPR